MIANSANWALGLLKVPVLVGVWAVAAILGASDPGFSLSNTSGETFVPVIWVDPDGCEHWVFDDGAEGYMTPHVTRDGRPVCRSGSSCGLLSADQLFATDSFKMGAGQIQFLKTLFANLDAKSVIISGHTDSREGDAYNLALSERRAAAVANVAKASGAEIFDVRGYGERDPKASNDNATGRAINRRVEIICVN